MKKITIIILSVLLIVGCATNENYTTDGPMSGPATNVEFKAYEEMCARNPLQVLCREENDE